MLILQPLGSVIELAAELAAQKIISGEMTRFEAFEYADKVIQEIINSEKYKEARQNVINQFADVKDIPFGHKTC